MNALDAWLPVLLILLAIAAAVWISFRGGERPR